MTDTSTKAVDRLIVRFLVFDGSKVVADSVVATLRALSAERDALLKSDQAWSSLLDAAVLAERERYPTSCQQNAVSLTSKSPAPIKEPGELVSMGRSVL